MGNLLVTGARGMLGRAVLACAPAPARGVDREDADLTRADDVRALFRTPWTGVVHCAGYTDVDRAEREPDEAFAGNAVATGLVAEACRAARIPLVVVSTDYVFDGCSPRPYTEADAPNPLGAYARSKREAEVRADSARIVRTAWLYGEGGRNFPDTMRRLAASGAALRVVDDQRGSPTWTGALAPVLWEVLAFEPGIYHATCEGACTWFEFAQAAVPGAAIEACSTREFGRPAPRPANSVLDCSKLAALRGRRLASWREALAAYDASLSDRRPSRDSSGPR